MDRESDILTDIHALARAETHRALDAALEWGLPKCRTDEERLLYPALLLVLGNLNALVAHRRFEPGDLASFQLTVSRARDDAPPARAHLVVRVASTPPSSSAEGETWFSAAAVRDRPLVCAGEALARLLGGDESPSD
jgi:hypothetical protein